MRLINLTLIILLYLALTPAQASSIDASATKDQLKKMDISDLEDDVTALKGNIVVTQRDIAIKKTKKQKTTVEEKNIKLWKDGIELRQSIIWPKKIYIKHRKKSKKLHYQKKRPIDLESDNAPILSKYQYCIEAIEKFTKQNDSDIEFLYNENSFVYKYENGDIYNFTGENGGSLIKGRSCNLKKPNDNVKAALIDILKRSLKDMDTATYSNVRRDCRYLVDDVFFTHGRSSTNKSYGNDFSSAKEEFKGIDE